jgi:chaperonin GroEL
MAKELRFGEDARGLLLAGVDQPEAAIKTLLLITNTLVAGEQTPWGGSPALMTEYGAPDEGLPQPSPDASTPQSLGLGPSVG